MIGCVHGSPEGPVDGSLEFETKMAWLDNYFVIKIQKNMQTVFKISNVLY